METSPATNQMSTAPETEKSGNGPLIGIILIILVLIVGGLYLWLQQVKQLRAIQQQESAVIQVGDPLQ